MHIVIDSKPLGLYFICIFFALFWFAWKLIHPFLEGVWGLFGTSCYCCFSRLPGFLLHSSSVKSLWDRHRVAMTTVFVLWLVGRLLRQQPRRAESTAGEGAPPPSLPRGRLSSAQKVPRSDATGGRRGSRGRRRRRGGPETSSTSLSLRTA